MAEKVSFRIRQIWVYFLTLKFLIMSHWAMYLTILNFNFFTFKKKQIKIKEKTQIKLSIKVVRKTDLLWRMVIAIIRKMVAIDGGQRKQA